MKEANQDRKICRTKERNNEGQNDRKKERDKERGGLDTREGTDAKAFRICCCRSLHCMFT